MSAQRLNPVAFFFTVAGRETVTGAGVVQPTGRMASTDSSPSWAGDSAIGLAGIDVWALELVAADDWEKYEPALGWPNGEALEARLMQERLPDML